MLIVKLLNDKSDYLKMKILKLKKKSHNWENMFANTYYWEKVRIKNR